MDEESQDVTVLHAENVGGIDETDVELAPGVTVLSGRNATNRTSFLQAIMTAMGSEETSLKGDAKEGVVELQMGDETYRRTLERSDGGGVVRTGDSYLDDPSLADLFAFLLERNEARQAVARGDDLRELIMRPVDTDEIEAEIESLKSERDQIDAQLEHIEDRKRDLPELERRRGELESQIEETREELAEKEAEIESLDADVEQAAENEVDSTLEELRETRSELEDVRYDIDTEEESLDSLRTELRERRQELESLPDAPEPDEQVDDHLQQLRDEKQQLDADISQLQSAISFNEEMLDSHGERVFQQDGGTRVRDGSVTDQLVEPETRVTCWTCGSTVDQSNIETTVDELKERRAEKIEDVSELEDDIESLQAERRERRERVQRRESVERRIEGLDDEIDERERRLEAHKDRADELRDEIRSLETEVEDADDGMNEVLERHREANDLEFELGQLESELDSVAEEIQVIEDQLDEESTLEARREEIGDELVDLRTRIDQVEREAVEQFNEHMAAILDILEYRNIDRIWIERVDREVREGRRKVERTQFELHVVRTTSGGATYEDTVDHLSESEREVTGLIFALAGYLVHELYEEVPFMLLDSLEAIDSERIAGLIDYFADFAPYLVVALLTEDAQALDDEYDRVTEI